MDWKTWLRARGIDPAGLAPADEVPLRVEYELLYPGGANGVSSAAGGATAMVVAPPPAAAPPAPPSPPAPTMAPTQAPSATVAPPAPVPSTAMPAGPAALDPEAVAGMVTAVNAAVQRRRTLIAAEARGLGLPEATVERISANAVTLPEAREMFLKELRDGRTASAGVPNIISHDRTAECNAAVLGAALMHRAGLRIIDPKAGPAARAEQERLAEVSHRYRNLPMDDICRHTLRLAGLPDPMSRQERARAAVGTAELAGIFTNVVTAQVMQTYSEAPDSTQGWVREEDVPNFMNNERHQLSTAPNLRMLPRGGTAVMATQSARHEDYKIARYAEQFAVDEQDIIDDRMNALTEMPVYMANAAARLRPDLVYAILLYGATATMSDGVALFDAATHLNLETHALSGTYLAVGLTAMLKQKLGAAILNLRPQYLIVSAALEFAALQLTQSAEIRAYGTAAAIEYPTMNPLKQRNLTVVTDGRIDSGVYDPATDYKTLRTGDAKYWYLACAASDHPTIAFGYLLGTGRRPQVDAYKLPPGQYGVGWTVKMDVGAKALDWRGLYHSTGQS